MLRRAAQSPWVPGTAWFPANDRDLGLANTNYRRAIDERYVASFRDQGAFQGAITSNLTRQNIEDYLEMLCFFRQLTPPSYLNSSPGATGEDTAVYFRNLGRELDLSPWFNGPCVIIIGHLRGVELPIPLRVGDDQPAATADSRVVVRFVYPLEVLPTKAFAEAYVIDEDDDEDDGEEGEEDENEKTDGAAP
jgi:hypothetical protein